MSGVGSAYAAECVCGCLICGDDLGCAGEEVRVTAEYRGDQVSVGSFEDAADGGEECGVVLQHVSVDFECVEGCFGFDGVDDAGLGLLDECGEQVLPLSQGQFGAVLFEDGDGSNVAGCWLVVGIGFVSVQDEYGCQVGR